MPASSPYKTFIESLRAARKARRLTQAQLAERVMLSRAQYTAIEGGRSTPNFRHLHNLATALRVRFIIGPAGCPTAEKAAGISSRERRHKPRKAV